MLLDAHASEEHHGALRDVDGDPTFSQRTLYVAEIRLQATYKQRWLVRRGDNYRVVDVEN